MTDHKNCKYHADCEYSNGVGGCPDSCVQFRHKDNVEVVRCEVCENWDGVKYAGRCKYWSAPTFGISHYTCADDFCSKGERRSE